MEHNSVLHDLSVRKDASCRFMVAEVLYSCAALITISLSQHATGCGRTPSCSPSSLTRLVSWVSLSLFLQVSWKQSLASRKSCVPKYFGGQCPCSTLDIFWLCKFTVVLTRIGDIWLCFHSLLLGITLATAMANAGLVTFDKIERTHPREIEMVCWKKTCLLKWSERIFGGKGSLFSANHRLQCQWVPALAVEPHWIRSVASSGGYHRVST